MDALALLCTLHADGPSTLRELRAAGCESLADLCVCDTQELAQYLELSVPSAERLQREAGLLSSRLNLLQPEAIDKPRRELKLERADAQTETPAREPEPPSPKPREVKPLPAALGSSSGHRAWFSATRIPLASTQPNRNTSMPVAPAPAQAPKVIEPIASTVAELNEEPPAAEPVVAAEPDQVAKRKRAPLVIPTALTADPIGLALEEARRSIEVLAQSRPVEVEPNVEPTPPVAETIRVEPQALSEIDEDPTALLTRSLEERLRSAAAERAHLPQPEPEPLSEAECEPETTTGATPLGLGQPEGLDAELLVALSAAGIQTAEALVQTSGLELSRKLSIPFTRLLELQLGAQHMFRRDATLVPHKPKLRRPPSTPSSPSGAPGSGRRHTDSYLPTPPAPTQAPNFDDSLDPSANGSVGGPFA